MFNENFLQGLSLYIDDMRLLKNIYNEFIIYYNRLNITELDCNKMLAIIAYKNLFPRDFADLQLNQGFLYTIFDSKDLFIADEIEKLDKQISEKSKEIDMAKNELLSTIKELDAAYEDKRPVRYGYKQALSDADKDSYAKRKQAIENRLNNNIPKLENEKLFLEQKRIAIQNRQWARQRNRQCFLWFARLFSVSVQHFCYPSFSGLTVCSIQCRCPIS